MVVSPQLVKYAKPMTKKFGLAYALLRDEKNSVASQFGLVFTLPNDLQALYANFGADLERYNGDDSWSLPMPARFIIDQRGIILHRQTDPDYTIRPEPNEIVTLLKRFAK